jgi:hypothetical protein
VLRVLEITGLDQVFTIDQTPEPVRLEAGDEPARSVLSRAGWMARRSSALGGRDPAEST